MRDGAEITSDECAADPGAMYAGHDREAIEDVTAGLADQASGGAWRSHGLVILMAGQDVNTKLAGLIHATVEFRISASISKESTNLH